MEPQLTGSLTLNDKQGVPATYAKQDLRDQMHSVIEKAALAHGIPLANLEKVYVEAINNLFDGANFAQLSEALKISLRPYIEMDSRYTYLVAAVLDHDNRLEVCELLGLPLDSTDAQILLPSLKHGIKIGRISEQVFEQFSEEDIAKLALYLDDQRSANFTYLGLQTLYDRYFLHDNEVRYETAQVFFMRVAIGHAFDEKRDDVSGLVYSEFNTLRVNLLDKALATFDAAPSELAKLDNGLNFIVDLYEAYSQFDYMSSTPSLFNAATIAPQMSSCYLSTIPDDLGGIYSALRDDALLSKFAGGLGNDWTPVRALNSYIKGTNGKSQGVVPFLKVANDTAVAVNQGGKRKGAMCAYLETWHLDIEEFLELRKNTGDDRRRTHDMNTANWIPDLFMKRMINNLPWTLFTPSETPDLHDLVGRAFEERYEYYEAHAKELGMLHKVVNATDLWRKMLGMVFETGHPWLTWKDVCNIRSPQDHVGVVHSSNLCTEITLNTSEEEIAVCNLGSVNVVSHVNKDGTINREKLARTVRLAVRALDNVIDANMYPVPQAKNANMRHRPVGLGLMGFQDALFKMGIDYASQQAIDFADEFQELLSYYAIEASADLAKIRGAYSTFKGSKWDRGIFPLDTQKLLEAERGEEYCQFDYSSHLGEEKWNELKAHVKQNGMRNSNVQAIAPTATISNIIGVSQSIEPVFQNVFVKSNLSGEFTVVNPYLQEALTELGLWTPKMILDIKNADGSVQDIDSIPFELRNRFCTAFEVGARWLVECAARRQKWIDQAQSLNLYIAGANGRKLDMTYKMAWLKGLKTTYYLRALSATQTEKVTGASTLNAVKPVTAPEFTQAAAVPGACSIDNPDCEACQ